MLHRLESLFRDYLCTSLNWQLMYLIFQLRYHGNADFLAISPEWWVISKVVLHWCHSHTHTMHTHMYAHAHTHECTHVHTHTYAYEHTHTHTYTEGTKRATCGYICIHVWGLRRSCCTYCHQTHLYFVAVSEHWITSITHSMQSADVLSWADFCGDPMLP